MRPDFEILPNVNRLQWDEKLLFEIRYIGFNLISRIISFDNLPQSVKIKIYTLTGQLVTDFGSDNSNGKLRWNARNDSGQDVATGGYLAVISGPGIPKVVKKILVIR